MVLIHTNLEASRLNKVKCCIFTPRQFRAFYMHSEGTRQGFCIHYLPNSDDYGTSFGVSVL